MKLSNTVLIASLATTFIGCSEEDALEREMKSYLRQGDHFTFQGEHANAARMYRKGTLLGSSVCMHSEMLALVWASGGTNQADLQRAAELAEKLRLKGDSDGVRKYEQLLMQIRQTTGGNGVR